MVRLRFSRGTSCTALANSYDGQQFQYRAIIAEGKGHRSDREFRNFLLHARGSLLEVQTQLLIAQALQLHIARRRETVAGVVRHNRSQPERTDQFTTRKDSLKRRANDQ